MWIRERYGGSTVQTASTGSLGLNTGGDTVSVRTAAGVVVATVTYGGGGVPAGTDQSIVRQPEYTGMFVPHGGIAGAGLQSPGVTVSGYGF